MDMSLFFVAVAGIALLLFLVITLRVPTFLALLVTSLLVGLVSGLEPEQVINSIKNGMGGTLGFVAIFLGLGGLGAILGQILESSGGIERIAGSLVRSFGPEKDLDGNDHFDLFYGISQLPADILVFISD